MENDFIVVKYGGNAMINDGLKKAVIEDIVVLVHGGGPEIDGMLRMAGIAKRVVNGLRYTDLQTMRIVQMVLCGKINKDLCSLIIKNGGNAIGLCGIDGALFRARRITHGADGAPLDLGLVGEIISVNAGLLHALTAAPAAPDGSGYIIPVVSPVAFAEDEGEPAGLNVNADTAAAKIAAALAARSLILMTDVPGIMRDVNDAASLISTITSAGLLTMQKSGLLSGGMIPKADCCRSALSEGVRQIRIIDGRLPHALHQAVAEQQPIGTTVTA